MEIKTFMLRPLRFVSSSFLIAGVLLSGCATPYQNPNLPNLIPDKEYFSKLDHSSGNKKVYDGFMQTMEIGATLLNSQVARAQLDHKARIYQWNESQYGTNKSQLEASLGRETKVFLSFFVPDRKNDDLHKPTTLWKVFLDVNGRRFEGKAEKIRTVLAEVQALYPSHTRFSTAYLVTFPVAASQIEALSSKLTLTGPVGSASVEFPAVQ